MSDHYQADTFYREFEIPLLDMLDSYRASVTVRHIVTASLELGLISAQPDDRTVKQHTRKHVKKNLT